MAKLEVLLSDDKRLRKKSKPVKEITPEIRKLIDDMLETMESEAGVGLAAPQVGEAIQLVLVKIPEEYEEEQHPGRLFVMFNPKIVRKRGREEDYEGCLSVPGYKALVARAEQVTVRALDENFKPIKVTAEGLLSRAFQHEIDHLNGVLYIDYLESLADLERVKSDSEEEEAEEATPV